MQLARKPEKCDIIKQATAWHLEATKSLTKTSLLSGLKYYHTKNQNCTKDENNSQDGMKRVF